MNTRIKELRLLKKLSQDAFGAKLGISGAAISRIESGERNVTDQVVLAIIQAFKVSEAWLRFGEGEPFAESPRQEEIKVFFDDLRTGPEDFRHKLVAVLAKLDTDEWKLLEKLAQQLAAEETKKAGQD